MATKGLDKVLDKAVDLARGAAVEASEDPTVVGKHLGSAASGEFCVTHLFAATVPGYRGWVWSVTVTRTPNAKVATVCEAHLVPADDALLAPAWVPWAERVRPGDLEGAMILPYIPDDPRLVAGYQATDEADADHLALWEMGLGRLRVLGADGRADAADRWYRGAHGPAGQMAATATCSSCAFMILMPGALRGTFGVCANEWSPSDGGVVSFDHGCGAHSETDQERQAGRWPGNEPVIDTMASAPFDLASGDDVVETAPELDTDAEGAADIDDSEVEETSAPE